MTKKERKALGLYIRWVGDAMELRDWTFELSRKEPDTDAFATVTPTYGRKIAVIDLCPDFRAMAPEKQRHVIVHELVHCHLEPAASMVRSDLEKHLGETTDRVFWDGFKRQVEYGVDALASAIAKHMPLIDWAAK